MPHSLDTLLALAEKICRLTEFSNHPLVPNDILPEIKAAFTLGSTNALEAAEKIVRDKKCRCRCDANNRLEEVLQALSSLNPPKH